MRRVSVGLASTLLGLWLVAGAAAQDPRQNEPGKFDFYVLALSWSPSFCEQAGERAPAPAVRRAALFVRGARAVAAIREGLPGVLPEPGAAPQPQHRLLDARPDAGAAADLPRMGQARRLLRPAGARLFRDGPQGARSGEDPGRISRRRRARSTVTPDEVEEAFVKANPGSQPRRDRGDLRRNAALRSAHLPVARPAVPRVSGDRQARLPPRAAGDAAGARGRIDAALRSFPRKRESRAPRSKELGPRFRGDERKVTQAR